VKPDLAGPDRPTLLNCVHCGLCLSACPTYRETKLETESPRGRIYLMRALSEGRLEPSREVSRHFDLCLNCRACETACPAGVHYGLLLETTRARLALELPPTFGERVRDFALRRIFPFQHRLDLLLGAVRASSRLGLLGLARGPLGRLLPKFARVGAELWPDDALDVAPMGPGVYPPYDGAPSKARVAWFRTCLMPGTFPATDRAAVHLLREAGATVVIPAAQGCCGSLHAHAGLRDTARTLALVNLRWFEDEGPFDLVATDVAGCGATLRELHELWDAGGVHDAALAERARAFSSKVRDVTEALVELGLPPARARVEQTIAVHDPCHLAPAQSVRRPPRLLLAALPGATLIELEGSDRCCGSAGIYNLVQPEMAARLLDRKMETVDASGASVIAVGNAGCLLQMDWGARRKGSTARMRHPVEIVAEAYPR
jgi:glycolate oxidase iron-sulfur subunit